MPLSEPPPPPLLMPLPPVAAVDGEDRAEQVHVGDVAAALGRAARPPCTRMELVSARRVHVEVLRRHLRDVAAVAALAPAHGRGHAARAAEDLDLRVGRAVRRRSRRRRGCNRRPARCSPRRRCRP